MTMPRKGTRKLVVDGETYRYRVNTYDDRDSLCFDHNEVVIECPGGERFKDTTKEESVTPRIVEGMVLAYLGRCP